MPENLAQTYDVLSERGVITKEIPSYIIDNLNKVFQVRPYQVEAISRMLYYFKNDYPKNDKGYLLFHMATGSGKTLLMASAMLHFYTEGYRNFIFFVDKTNIIKKTEDNFLNKASKKYLFNGRITIGGKDILVQAVKNFSQSNADAINILFTTIAGLHSKIQNPQENNITKQSFAKVKTILISDEAHHINAKTRRSIKPTKEDVEEMTWEDTAQKLFKSNPAHILLEYTATIEERSQAILDKYEDKIIYHYSLRQFRADQYSKDIYVYQSGAGVKDRMLQAVILSQYRRKLAGINKISLKPVILMKSKTIEASKGSCRLFKRLVADLSVRDIKRIRDSVDGLGEDDQILKKSFQFFKDSKIKDTELVQEIKIEFEPNRCVEVNNQEQSEIKQLQLNSLEEENNLIRVVFAVDMLNEGWDVLNLFDIVRLYETRDSRSGRGGKTTIREAQLIGRGARYFPFAFTEAQDKYKRKYDEDKKNELRALEQLYYHSLTDNRYIQELKKELIKTGIQANPNDIKTVSLKLKENFKKSKFFKNAVVFKNKRIKNLRTNIVSLKSFAIPTLYQYSLAYATRTDNLFDAGTKNDDIETITKRIKIKELPVNVVRKALDKNDFYNFSNLKEYLPNLRSINEFIFLNEYCGLIEVELTLLKGKEIIFNSKPVLECLISLFESIKTLIIKGTSVFIGTEKFEPETIRGLIKEEVWLDITLPKNNESEQERGKGMSTNETTIPLNLQDKDWYVFNENYGTDQEKHFVKFIHSKINQLKNIYNEIYVIRNEKFITLYDFKDGQGFEPDFLLYVVSRKSKDAFYYQLFIEPKGAHLKENDAWKEDFLKTIKQRHSLKNLFENADYEIFGMPFFNKNNEEMRLEFEKSFGKILKVK